jgi:hypothetical protein
MSQELNEAQTLYLNMKKLGEELSQKPEFADLDIKVLLSPKDQERKVSVDCDDELKRSLGGEMQFASSDISELKKGSNEEAEAIFSNCNIKIAMKNTDSPTEE